MIRDKNYLNTIFHKIQHKTTNEEFYMRIFKSIQKIFAGVIAGVMIALGCISTIPASAVAATSPVPNSNLAYTVKAEVITKDSEVEGAEPWETPMIRLTVDFTNNPGFSTISLAVKYDSNCVYGFGQFDDDNRNNPQPMTFFSDHSDKNTVICIYNAKSGIQGAEYAGRLTMCLYFEANDSYNVAHSFSVGTYNYKSEIENVTYDRYNCETLPSSEFVRETKNDIVYFLGDIDANEEINVDDSYYILRIANNSYKTVAEVNNLLKTNSNWKATYPMMVCAEVADVNEDNKINSTDSDLVLEYYASISVGKDVISKIGTQRIKTVYA